MEVMINLDRMSDEIKLLYERWAKDYRQDFTKPFKVKTFPRGRFSDYYLYYQNKSKDYFATNSDYVSPVIKEVNLNDYV